ncbi:MAG: outer membrane beta-barrel family protein [Chryseobacterium sp.]|jgi:outer membrane receptor protein involved in Fe transport|uniref:outer membrane beta-barrel family protein n=1 Tax=Chryseobacterium sp. TaxID=1871047 RepID=UPI0028325ADF|nr:outer membrane beta-barrel family protein [Chryseobacterium sp.]MDR2237606.1 outer membrane beta-barrel family protein [Chryseobacterium sp.]
MKKISILISALYSIFLSAQAIGDTVKVKTIESVSLEGRKKIIERKVDRLIYDVQNSMVSQGSSGTEVLANTPLLKLDEDKGLLSIVGKSGVSVMVNDRMLNLSGPELMNYLKNLRSENIAKIEVITTPPAKYDAQGNSGIINIVLKKNLNLGWSGYLNTYYKQSTFAGFGGSIALNYQNEKLKASLKLRGYDDEKRSVENYDVISNRSSVSRDDRRDMNDGLGANINLDYSLSGKSNIGLIYDIADGHSNMDIASFQDYFNGDAVILRTTTDSRHRSTSKSRMLNLYFDQKIGEHKLSLGANYYGNLPKTNVNFTTTDLSDYSEDMVRNLSSVDYKIYSGQADLTLNFKKIQLETGAKYSQFSNRSDIGYFDFKGGQYVADPTKSNLFDYDEKNYAAYLSASKDFGEKWSAKLGFRYEYAETKGYSPTTQSLSENKYGKLFPSAYISYKANDHHQFSLNYSRRINRPGFRALDPFRWYSNPYSYYTGNPGLLPSFNDNIEFNYIFKNKWSANLFYQRSTSNFEQITFPDGIYMTSTYENYYNQDNYGINLNYTDTFFKIWESSFSASYSYSDTQITKFNATVMNGQSFYYSTNNTFRLNKEKTFYFFLNYWQSLPSRGGNSTSKSNASLNAGVKMSLMDKKLQMNVSVNDIFRQAGYRGSAYYEDNIQTFNNYWDARKLTLSVTYSFGNQKVKSNSRTVNFEDKNRAD